MNYIHALRKIAYPATLSATLATALAIILSLFCQLSANAAPPVRIAVVSGGGSGIEQSAVDRIGSDLSQIPNVVISTLNPDWYVVCNVVDSNDVASGSVKVNGTVTIKTVDGQVIHTASLQTNKQDFSLQPGAPVNKALVTQATRELLGGMAQRIRQPLQEAVAIEIETRDKIIDAQVNADQDQYDQAIAILMPISPDTPHFKGVRELISQFQIEKQCLETVNKAKEEAKKGQYSQAIATLKDVDKRSKRFKEAQNLIASYKAQLAKIAARRKKPQTAKVSSGGTSSSNAQIKAIDAQRKALDAQMKALDAQEAALKNKSKP